MLIYNIQTHTQACRHTHTHMHKWPSQKKNRRNKPGSVFSCTPFLRPPGGELLIDRSLNAGGFPVIEKDFS